MEKLGPLPADPQRTRFHQPESRGKSNMEPTEDGREQSKAKPQVTWSKAVINFVAESCRDFRVFVTAV